jgi:hypothetical protein
MKKLLQNWVGEHAHLSDPKFIFLKFQEERTYIEKLSQGIIYANTVEYFRNCEKKDEVRSDPDEALGFLHQGEKTSLKIEINGKSIFLDKKNGLKNFRVTPNEDLLLKVFCLTSGQQLHNGSIDLDAQDKNLVNKKYSLAIFDPMSFLIRIDKALSDIKIDYQMGFVEYIDETYHGDIGPFKKFKKFSSQKEFRIVFREYSRFPFKLDIGDISDISRERTDGNQLVK